MLLLPYLNLYILGSMLVIVLFLVLLYLINYQLPAISLQIKTKRINSALRSLSEKPLGSINPNEIDEIFQERPFNYVWKEFKNSLHEVTNEEGNDKTVRSTLTADFYFAKEAIVDSYINVEFFKHLPGIFTGIGIIGTFSGLIWGLHQFNTTNAVETLNLLLGEVSSAFVGSGIAIFVAILITFFEKQTLNTCYKLLDETSKLLDSLYKTGVGEDYLARLVKATETSARNSIDFKQVLIDNLEVMMDKQSMLIGRTIAQSLESPIDKLLLIVNKASGDQSDVIKNLVDSLMNTFIAKIDQAFGTQIEAVNQAIYRSTTTMESVEESMRRLLNDIAMASQNAVKSMSDQMLETVIQANINQDQKNETLRKVIDDLNQLNHEHLLKSHSMIDEVMNKVLGSFQKSLDEIAQSREQQNLHDENRNQVILTSAKELHTGTQLMLNDSLNSLNQFLNNLQLTLKISQTDQYELNLKLKSFVEEINQLSFDNHVKSRSVIDESLEKVLLSFDSSMKNLYEAREAQNIQDEYRNELIVNSLQTFQGNTQSLLKNSQDEQFELNLKLKNFVEELNQLTYDSQIKSKNVIDQTLDQFVKTIDLSLHRIALSQESLSSSDEVRNQKIITSTNDLYHGMTGILEKSMSDQLENNLKLKDLVAELNQMNIMHLNQTRDIMQSSTIDVLERLQNALQMIADDRAKQIESDEQRAIELNQATSQLHHKISEQVKFLIVAFNSANEQSQNHIQAIQKSSIDAIEKMGLSSSILSTAADKFADAGNIVIGSFEKSKVITEQMEVIGSKLQVMMSNIHDLFKQFEQSSHAHQDYLKELTELIASAKKESGVSAAIVTDMESALGALNSAERSSKEYLNSINQVLKDAFSQFNTQMMAQVTSLNQENDRLLGGAINALTGAVEQIVQTTTKLAQK